MPDVIFCDQSVPRSPYVIIITYSNITIMVTEIPLSSPKVGNTSEV